MKPSIFLIFSLGILLFSTHSCKTREKLVYFQNGSLDSLENIPTSYNPTFQADDFLNITVTALEPESVLPFNLVPPAAGGSTSSSMGYLIDNAGNIQFPILGTLALGGLNRQEAVQLIQTKLKGYLQEPGVQIQIMNYKITILGDVRTPGTYTIPNERITLLEAIGLSGDLNITGQRNNVLVVREENGQKKEYRIDLTDKSIFESPVYYLKQNDVVYVEPNMAARTQSTFWKTSGTVFIPIASLIITSAILLIR